mgnify:CR=1 FL=1
MQLIDFSGYDFTLGTAESLTGGAVAKAISSVPGSSRYFKGGIVAYATVVKESVLNVPKTVVAENGVVSCEVAEAMAKGCLNVMNVDFAISTTGIAGPTGGSEKTPIGTVCIAVAGKNFCHSWQEHFEGDRGEVVEASVEKGLEYLNISLKTFATRVV